MVAMRKAGIMLLSMGMTLGVAAAQNDNGGAQDMKNAGHETVAATKDAGNGIKQGTKKGYHKTKRGTKHVAHKVHHAVDPN